MIATTKLIGSALLVLVGIYLLSFGNSWAPRVFESLSASKLGAWIELIVPFLPIVLIGLGAALYTSRR